MPNNNYNEQREKKALKTAVVLMFILEIPQLLFGRDSRIGNAVGLVAAIRAMIYFYDLGRRRRPGSSMLANAARLFQDPVRADRARFENTVRNVINGGAAVFDQVFCG